MKKNNTVVLECVICKERLEVKKKLKYIKTGGVFLGKTTNIQFNNFVSKHTYNPLSEDISHCKVFSPNGNHLMWPPQFPKITPIKIINKEEV